ncbi:MAG: F0F1 ATP synthase subunit delta [Candidatus Orphnella occulta]|nr:F0F1 ATP synthase subunit delta [Candidatus Orphnella occulta]
MPIWQLILIQLVTFIFIVLFLRWLLSTHIGHALKRLQQLNQQNQEKEKALKEELDRARREVKRKIEEGQQQAEDIKKQARIEAEKDRENIFIRAKEEAQRMTNDAVRDCQRKEAELTVEMQQKSVYLAADMISYIFTEKNQKDLHAKLIDELIDEVKKLQDDKIKAEGDKAEVICAYELSDNQRKKIKEVLSNKLKRDIGLVESIDKEIVDGLIIRLGGFVIDGSIKNKLKKILPLMKEKVKTL